MSTMKQTPMKRLEAAVDIAWAKAEYARAVADDLLRRGEKASRKADLAEERFSRLMERLYPVEAEAPEGGVQ